MTKTTKTQQIKTGDLVYNRIAGGTFRVQQVKGDKIVIRDVYSGTCGLVWTANYRPFSAKNRAALVAAGR